MTSSVRPRTLVHRGVVEAHALAFDTVWLGESEARRRALSVLEDGARVDRVAEWLVVSFRTPRRIDCDRSTGTALVEASGVRWAAPFSPRERAALAAPSGSLVLVRAAEAQVLCVDDRTREDPAAWLDTSHVACARTEPFGEAPAPEPPVITPPHVGRQDFGVPPPSEDAKSLWEALARAGRPVRSTEDRPGLLPWLRHALVSAERPAALRNMLGWISWPARLVAWSILLAWAPAVAWTILALTVLGLGVGAWASAAASPASPAQTAPAPAPSPAPARASWLSRLRDALLLRTRLGQLLGWRYAREFQKLVDLFERGDLDEALRRALPIDGKGLSDDLPMAMKLLADRQRLSVDPDRGAGASSTVSLPPEAQERLRALYRLAYGRLRREGRIDEAAFVLADLLHAEQEAVDLLEKRGRLELAVRLAEARHLPATTVVRLLLRAGERARAVAYARLHGCFASAILLLESRNDRAAAAALRAEWAECLVRAGDYAAAVDAVWPVPDLRARAAPWLHQALTAQGPMAARVAPRAVTMEGALRDEAESFTRALAAARGPDGARLRSALARHLLAEAPAVAHAGLARPLVRALLRDRAEDEPLAASKKELAKLLDRAQDDALRVDAGRLPRFLRSTPGEAATHVVVAHDSGALPVEDACLLPDGRTLVALGSHGVVLLTPDGRTAWHVPQPCNALVVSDAGTRALCLEVSEGRVRVSRLDLLGRRAAYWLHLPLSAWTTTFDGDVWHVVHDRTLRVVDATSDDARDLFRVQDLPGPAVVLSRSAQALGLLLDVTEAEPLPAAADARHAFAFEYWSYRLIDLQLTRRSLAKGISGRARRVGRPRITADRGGSIVATDVEGMTDGTWLLHDRWDLQGRNRVSLEPGSAVLDCDLQRLLVAQPMPDGSGVGLWDCAGPFPRRLLELHGSGCVSARLHASGERVTAFDDRGRIVVLSLPSGRVVRDLRVRV